MHISKQAKERLILSADDYGIRDTARQILPLAESGKLQRVAVMVNYCRPEDAKRLLSTGVSIDIHLDLIGLMGRGTDPGQGTAGRGLHFIVRRFLGFLPADAVEAEWRRQIGRFRELFGRLPDGLNSHEHVHFFPSFFDRLVALAHEFHVPYLRLGQSGMLLSFHHSAIGHVLARLASRNRRRFEKAGLATSTYLVSLDWVRNKEPFFQALSKLSAEESVELVVHPERAEERRFIEHHF